MRIKCFDVDPSRRAAKRLQAARKKRKDAFASWEKKYLTKSKIDDIK